MQKVDKPRVIIDTNLLISTAIISKGLPNKLVKAWFQDLFILIVSKEQLEEIQDVSKRKKFTSYPLFSKRIGEFIENITFAAEIAELLTQLPIHSRDQKDDFLLAAALGSQADYLITDDDDLLVLNGDSNIGKLKILTVIEFLNL